MLSQKCRLAICVRALLLLLIGRCTSTRTYKYNDKGNGVLNVKLEMLGMNKGMTWLIQLNSTLLDSPTPAYFLGVVPANAVATACNMIERGHHIIPASITAQGRTENHNLKVISTKGCDVSSSPPEGVHAVFSDRDGIKNFLVCHKNHTYTVGCALYRMDDNANAIYEEVESGNSTRFHDFHDVYSANHLLPVDKRRLDIVPQCVQDGVAKSDGIRNGIFLLNFIPLFQACISGQEETGVDLRLCLLGGLAESLGKAVAIAVIIECTGSFINSCFPGDGLVTLHTGLQKPMMELSIGDQVAVMKANGRIAFDEVYAFGHNDPNGMSFFVKLTLKPTWIVDDNYLVKSLELSPRHFVPVSLVMNGYMVYKRAKDIHMGDLLWVNIHHNNTLEQFVVTDSVMTFKTGLYNPFTLSGNVLVGDVVASTHSDWFLDDLFDSIGITHWLPIAYQMVLFPIRMLYRILGKNAYSRLYLFLDTRMDLSTLGTHHGGHILVTITMLIFITIPSLFYLKRCSKSRPYIYFIDYNKIS
ncbi:hypothetical protein O6H91_09G106900 [Diphasiastrum complanatum]|uniref:Uncharacterized protein n=1 Tax=Diphasiastrum complanatum TaxID=34168 RepID=A0ACC2CSR7_DIPCM|nr:hypothetical protein O6H91_09G106900 [Diphasiastrum complanatum]